MDSSSSSVRVFCRFRPTRPNHESVKNEIILSENTNSIILGQRAKFKANVAGGGKFHFDSVFPETATQQNVFEKVGNTLMEDTFKGYNSSIIAYGQTGSGKTHTMFGPGWDESGGNASPLAPAGSFSGMEGLVPRIASNLFGEIEQKCSKSTKLDINVYVTIIEIYNETIRDLLKAASATDDPKPKTLKLRESKSRGVYIDGIERRKGNICGVFA